MVLPPRRLFRASERGDVVVLVSRHHPRQHSCRQFDAVYIHPTVRGALLHCLVAWTSCARTWRHSSSPSFYGICKTDVTFVVHRLTAHRRWRCCPPNQTCPSQLIPSILPYPTTTQGPSTTKKSASRVQEPIFSSHGGRAGPCRLW